MAMRTRWPGLARHESKRAGLTKCKLTLDFRRTLARYGEIRFVFDYSSAANFKDEEDTSEPFISYTERALCSEHLVNGVKDSRAIESVSRMIVFEIEVTKRAPSVQSLEVVHRHCPDS